MKYTLMFMYIPSPCIRWTKLPVGEQIRSLMAAMIGKPKLALGSQDFASFLEYYERLCRGDKQGAALLADNRGKH